MACAAIAGSIRAGCLTDSGTYRPRRCTGPVDWAVAHTDSRSRGISAVASAVVDVRGAVRAGLVGAVPAPALSPDVLVGSSVHRRDGGGCSATAITTPRAAPALRPVGATG